MAEEAARKQGGSSSTAALWVGLLAPPVVWAGQLQLSYLLVRAACHSGRNLLLYLVTCTALLITGGAGLLDWRNWQNAGRRWPDESADADSRSRFISVVGLLGSGLFFIVILAQGIATTIFQSCQQ